MSRVDAAALFARFFLPLYPADAREDLARARGTDANPAGNPALVAHLDDAAAGFVRNAPALFGGRVGADLGLDRSDASVHRLSAALTRERRDAWAAMGEPGSAENALFNAVVHGAAYVGACIVANYGEGAGAREGVSASWGVRRPLWESVVRLRSHAGEGDLAVFHWWLKSLADDAQGTTLADRYRAYVEVPCARPELLPILAIPEGRSLPRLKGPRYDLLYKYLRAHLPELRDLGADFPSPERFEAFGLRWLDFYLVGGGRMLLLAGAAPEGLHLFWLTAAGFEKSAFFPCEAVPAPIVRLDGDRIVAMTSEAGTPRVHEMLWWGP
jgi:hypothetical protein